MPLHNQTILVTRASGQSESLSSLIRQAGGTPFEIPLIEFIPPQDTKALETARERTYEWVVFTSANAVKFFVDRKIKAKVAAIGKKTVLALNERNVSVDLIPDEAATSDELLDALLEQPIAGKTILIPRAEEARDVLPEGLRTAGAIVEVVVAYRTIPSKDGVHKLREIMDAAPPNWLTFTSGSTVRAFFDAAGVEGGREWIRKNGIRIAVLGRVTEGVLLEYEMEATVTAAEPTMESLIAAMED
jgi:uroporphyrinogen-III synthase